MAFEETEPPVPAGLGDLSAGLQAIVDFFAIDEDLIAAAAAMSPAITELAGLAEWVAALPPEEKDELLARTAAELWEAAADLKDARVEAEKQRRAEDEGRRAAAQAAARAKRLDQLATRTEKAWEKVAEWIGTRRPSEYDRAVRVLRDLQALAERDGYPDLFGQRFGELRAQHQRKPTLQERFDRAGLPGE
ncbi:MAG TPA: hypothetical protein VGI96_27000 [Streptosporangiaceae bacterium]